MRPPTRNSPLPPVDARSAPAPQRTLVGAVLFVAAALALLLAVSHPTATALVLSVGVAGWLALRSAWSRVESDPSAPRPAQSTEESVDV